MYQDIDRVVADLVEYLRENSAWCEAQGHEGWIAVETASYFRRKLRVGAARDAPYVVVTGEQKKPTKYADVYVRYQPDAEKGEPWHLFFEFKCIPKSALSWKATLGAFTEDVEKKLTSLDVAETNSIWRAGEDAWCRNLGELRFGLTEGRVIGIGVLFVALVDDGRLERLKQIRKDNRGSIVSILDRELPPDDDGVVTLCLAYGVDLTPDSATREPLIPTQDAVETWRQEGRRQGFRELLLHLLRRRFGEAVDAEVEPRVAKASIQEIETWAERLPTVAGLAEVFAD